MKTTSFKTSNETRTTTLTGSASVVDYGRREARTVEAQRGRREVRAGQFRLEEPRQITMRTMSLRQATCTSTWKDSITRSDLFLTGAERHDLEG